MFGTCIGYTRTGTNPSDGPSPSRSGQSGNTAELEQAAREAFDAGGRDMVIDLSKAPSLTSAGIRAILTIHRMLTKAGKDKGRPLKLVSPTPYVREVLEVAGLLDYIEIYPRLSEAVALF